MEPNVNLYDQGEEGQKSARKAVKNTRLAGGEIHPHFAQWQCLECGKTFRTTAAAERASNNGCPKCGGVDIDLC